MILIHLKRGKIEIKSTRLNTTTFTTFSMRCIFRHLVARQSIRPTRIFETDKVFFFNLPFGNTRVEILWIITATGRTCRFPVIRRYHIIVISLLEPVELRKHIFDVPLEIQRQHRLSWRPIISYTQRCFQSVSSKRGRDIVCRKTTS